MRPRRPHNRAMTPAPAAPRPLDDNDIQALQAALEALPAPMEPMDVMAIDGYLCGVLLQPQTVPAARWQAHVTDLEGRRPPPGADTATILDLVSRRYAELRQAIDRRDWFDPWIFPLGHGDGDDDPDAAPPSETVLPWVAGFATAMDLFPALMAVDDPALVEPLALLYLHFDPADLEDADALQAVIETLEPPADLAEAVQDLVRALMLIADVTRPRPVPRAPQRPVRPGPPGRRRR